MKHSSISLKKLLLVATITFISTSAALAILFVLFGASSVAWKVNGTVAILGLLSLLSMNNICRLESSRQSVRRLSSLALISNIFWSIPWILLLWGAFRALLCDETFMYGYGRCSAEYYDSMEVLYKVIVTAGIVSATSTVVANLLNVVQERYTRAVRALRISSLSSAVILGVYFLPAIWFENGDYISDSWRFLAIVGIVFVFSSILLPILIKIQTTKASSVSSSSATSPQPAVASEEELRKRIEAEVRAEIAAEQTKSESK